MRNDVADLENEPQQTEDETPLVNPPEVTDDQALQEDFLIDDSESDVVDGWKEGLREAEQVIEQVGDEPTPPPEEPAEPTEDVVEAAPVSRVDGYLSNRARELGLDPAEFAEDPETLARVMDAVERRTRELHTTYEKTQAEQHSQQRAEEVTPEQRAAADEEWNKWIKYNLEFENPDEIDPGIRQVLEGMNDHYAQHTDRLHTVLREVVRESQDHKRYEQEKEWGQFLSRFDGYVDGLGEEWKDVLGTKENQERVRNKMGVLAGSYLQMPNQELVPESQLFEEAVNLLFADKQRELDRHKLAEKVQRNGKQIIARPTHRKGTEMPSPDDAAKNFVKGFFADRPGMFDDPQDGL